MAESLCEVVREAEQNLLSGTVKLGEHVDWSLHDTTERIFAYLNSRHTSGGQDSLGRDKPFFNIVTSAVNIWYRATDLDRKDITVLPSDTSSVAGAFFATVLLQEWMKKAKFGMFLNSWGRTLAQYGSAIVKFVDSGGELTASVIPWNRAIVDPIDFYALPRIEKFYKTPAQLKDMATKGHPDYAGYNLEVVMSLEDSLQSRENLRGEQQDNMANFVELYEVHGELPQAVYKESKGQKVKDDDEDVFFQQMHVVCWTKGKDGKNQDFTLYSGREKKDPYMLTHLIEEDGRTLAIGAVEHLFDAQWMQNHTIKAWKDQMDLASRLIFQTADSSFVGRNVLTNLEVGDILVHETGKPMESFPNIGHDITNLQAFAAQWKPLERDVTSTPDAARGVTPPSGVPLGTTQIVTAQGLNLFEIMTENKALALEEMLREFVIPHLKTKLNNKDEIMAILDDHNLQKLDSMYVPREAVRRFNKRVVQEVLNDGVPSPYQADVEEMGVRQDLAKMGNMRPLSPGDVTWREALKDLEWKLDINISNEAKDKQAILTTLDSTLKTIAAFAGRPMNPDERLVFNKLMSASGTTSPLELSSASSAPAPMNPAMVGAGGQSPDKLSVIK